MSSSGVEKIKDGVYYHEQSGIVYKRSQSSPFFMGSGRPLDEVPKGSERLSKSPPVPRRTKFTV